MNHTLVGFARACRMLFFSMMLFAFCLGTGCNLAPDYVKPSVEMPTVFKEQSADQSTNVVAWATAKPSDDVRRGNWWEVFSQPELNLLEEQISVSNQTVAAAAANFLAARAVVKQNEAALFPTVSMVPSATRMRTVALHEQSATPTHTTISDFSLPFDASWALDFWGAIRNNIRASAFQAEASQADMENIRLSMQSELAADYFQVRLLDMQRQLLDSTVLAYRDSLRLTQVRRATGIDSDQAVAQAETQLHVTQAQADDLGIARAQLEHAIALLLGKPVASFSIPTNTCPVNPPAVPGFIPSQLLERRPDIAASERLVAAANAQIGVARAAYFPTITLSGSAGFQRSAMGHLISAPDLGWSMGAALSQTIFDAGKTMAMNEQARANYQAVVANYRQAVLAAFAAVEDNLVALRILSQELVEQDAAVASSQRYLKLANDRYMLGIDNYLDVITAQTTCLNNQRTAINLRSQQMTATIQLIAALGGGWTGLSAH